MKHIHCLVRTVVRRQVSSPVAWNNLTPTFSVPPPSFAIGAITSMTFPVGIFLAVPDPEVAVFAMCCVHLSILPPGSSVFRLTSPLPVRCFFIAWRSPRPNLTLRTAVPEPTSAPPLRATKRAAPRRMVRNCTRDTRPRDASLPKYRSAAPAPYFVDKRAYPKATRLLGSAMRSLCMSFASRSPAVPSLPSRAIFIPPRTTCPAPRVPTETAP